MVRHQCNTVSSSSGGTDAEELQASVSSFPIPASDASPGVTYHPDRAKNVALQQRLTHGLPPPTKNTFIHFDVPSEDLGMDSRDNWGMFAMPVDTAASCQKQEDSASQSPESSLSDELISRWVPSLTSSSGSSRSGRRSLSLGAAVGRPTVNASNAQGFNGVAVAKDNNKEPQRDPPRPDRANPVTEDNMQKHDKGLCHPCVFWSKNQCTKGAACRHCHLPHGDMPKRLRRSKQARQRMRNRQSRDAQEEGDDVVPRQLVSL